MKNNTPLQSRNLWAVTTFIAAAIGLRVALLADPAHPPAPEPAAQPVVKSAPAAPKPQRKFDRIEELPAFRSTAGLVTEVAGLDVRSRGY